MGTRHLTAVVLNGEYKVAQYGQWDGYLSGQGETIVKFLNSPKFDLNKFKKAVLNSEFISEEENEKIWNKFASSPHGMTMSDSEKFKKAYPALSRDTGAEVLNVILKNNGAKLTNSIDFAADSLFCEFAYVLDLDNEIFEIYQGFNTENLAKDERFSQLKVNDEKYKQVKFLMAFDLNNVSLDDLKYLELSLNEKDLTPLELALEE